MDEHSHYILLLSFVPKAFFQLGEARVVWVVSLPRCM